MQDSCKILSRSERLSPRRRQPGAARDISASQKRARMGIHPLPTLKESASGHSSSSHPKREREWAKTPGEYCIYCILSAMQYSMQYFSIGLGSRFTAFIPFIAFCAYFFGSLPHKKEE